jgi:hypothetical protein
MYHRISILCFQGLAALMVLGVSGCAQHVLKTARSLRMGCVVGSRCHAPGQQHWHTVCGALSGDVHADDLIAYNVHLACTPVLQDRHAAPACALRCATTAAAAGCVSSGGHLTAQSTVLPSVLMRCLGGSWRGVMWPVEC